MSAYSPQSEMISSSRLIFRYHFARMWANRHSSPHYRASMRANIRGQRSSRAYESSGMAQMVRVECGSCREAR